MDNNRETIEVLLQGEPLCWFRSLEELDELYDRQFHADDGFYRIDGLMCGDHGHQVYFNRTTKVAECLSWRTFTGFYDCNGYKIYEDSELETIDGEPAVLEYYTTEDLSRIVCKPNVDRVGWYIRTGSLREQSIRYHLVEEDDCTKKLKIIR